MIASLMMYARPELDAAHARFWAAIRSELLQRSIACPANLSNDADEFEVWQSPQLILSQTCGMPYRLWLHDQVSLVGTPDFGVSGCPPGYYKSALIVRANDERGALSDFETARFTFNQTYSQSGYAAPYAHVSPLGFWFRNRSQSHGHLMSARAVAEGRADIAALDAVSWRLIRRYESFAADLRVLDWTAPTPGLPYIAGPTAQRDKIRDAVAIAIAKLNVADREVLGIKALIDIPKEAYLAIPNPPEGV